MPIYSLKRIGSFHTNHCEDETFYAEIEKDLIVMAVADGCTMGTDSHFAAGLAKKLLQKTARDLGYQNRYSPDGRLEEQPVRQVLETYFLEFFHALKRSKNELALETNELLFTLLLAVVNPKQDEAAWLAIGDGLVVVNGSITEIDQNDRPDYYAYHLSAEPRAWLKEIKNRGEVAGVRDMVLSTDGVLTFRSPTDNHAVDPLHELLLDRRFAEFSNMMDRKMIHLEQEGQFSHGDDLGIVRWIK